MTFKQLRRILTVKNPRVIQWNPSGVVELATLQPNGAIHIHNRITNKSYSLPKNYVDLNIRILKDSDMVSLGDLLPKDMR